MNSRFVLFLKRKHTQALFHWISRLAGWLLVMFSLVIAVVFVYRIGFIGWDANDSGFLHIYKLMSLPYAALLTLKGVINRFMDGVQAKSLSYLLYFALLLYLFVPEWQGETTWEAYRWLQQVVGSGLYLSSVLLMLSLVQLFTAFVYMMKGRVNPSKVIIGGFLTTILIGTGLLMLPNATYDGIGFIDALFVATSAVCVTGLTPVAIDLTFTPLGNFFLILLIQIGGIGVMTLTSFFVFFFIGHVSVYSQMSVKEAIGSEAANTLTAILRRIIGITAFIELIGASLLWISVHGRLGLPLAEEITFSLFHSISAFCNAGFSTLPSNLCSIPLDNHLFFIIISLLIVFGGVGFPVLSNAGKVLMSKIRRKKRLSSITLYHLNTRVAVLVTLILLVGGTVVIGILEWNHSFRGISAGDKIVQAFFNATTPRTAGFNSLPMEAFTLQTTLVTIILMWFGGGSQSTAGGIKVNTLGVIYAVIRSVVRRNERVELMGREIPIFALRFAYATVVCSISFISIAVFALTFTDGTLPLLRLFYEAVSAISIVGLSLNTTPLLSNGGKLIVVSMMFIGRVGLLTLLWSIFKAQHIQRYRYPTDPVIIN